MALSRVKGLQLFRSANNAQLFTKPVSRSISFFSRKKKEEDVDELDMRTESEKKKRKFNAEEASMKYNLNRLKEQSLDTKRGYSPPHDIEEKVERALREVINVKGDWRETVLNNTRSKFTFISSLTRDLEYDMPGSVLTDAHTAADVLAHFQTPVRTTTALEDLSKIDLPENLNIQTQYHRFDPETDTFFGGATAFPGENTTVTSIKYKRKYNDVITKEPKAGYIDHYKGY